MTSRLPEPGVETVAGLGVADRVTVTVGSPAHGGHCVARHDGVVVFVRHALPGERVTVEITEVHRGYLRGDAVEVLEASPDRVPAPCPYAHAFGCGGCDLQHVSVSGQAAWKTAVVAEQLTRLGRLTDAEVAALNLRVEQPSPVAGEPAGLGWRTRVRYRVDAAGRPGLLAHRSHEVVPIARCAIAHPAIRSLDVLDRRWPSTDVIDVVAAGDGQVTVLADADVVSGPPEVTESAAGHVFHLPATGFWQVHPAAARTLAEAVLDAAAPRPGERAWDLYGGAGLFAAALADAVGPQGEVVLVEAAPEGVAAARRNLDGMPVRIVAAPVERALTGPRRGRRAPGGGSGRAPAGNAGSGLPAPDVVVLDPPRTGAGAAVLRAIDAAGPRAITYVACDPAALGRDVRTLRERGWHLTGLRVFDLFPQTHHVECVAHFTR